MSVKTKAIPDGYRRVTPPLVVQGGEKALEFHALKRPPRISLTATGMATSWTRSVTAGLSRHTSRTLSRRSC